MNLLQIFPTEIIDLPQLKILILHKNPLGAIPKEIENIATLEELNLRYTGLEKIPGEIGNLPNLGVLNQAANELTSGSCGMGCFALHLVRSTLRILEFYALRC